MPCKALGFGQIRVCFIDFGNCSMGIIAVGYGCVVSLRKRPGVRTYGSCSETKQYGILEVILSNLLYDVIILIVLDFVLASGVVNSQGGNLPETEPLRGRRN